MSLSIQDKSLKLSISEIIQLLCLYFVACTHYIDGLVKIALYIVLPLGFLLSLKDYHKNQMNKAFRTLIWLYCWVLFCAFLSTNTDASLSELKKIAGCVMSSFMMLSLAKDLKRVYLLYITFLLFLISTWQYALGHIYEAMDISSSQLDDQKLNANTFAYFTTYATFVIYMFGYLKSKYAKYFKMLFPLTLLLSFITAIYSASRQILVIQIPFILLLLINRYNFRSGKGLMLFIGIIAIAIAGYFYFGETMYANSYLSTRAEMSIEDDTRIIIAKECIQIGKENFLFGVGPGCVSKHVSTGNFSHNTYLELFAGTGLVGMIIFITMILSFINAQFRRYKVTHDTVFMAFVIFGVIWAIDQIFYVFHTGLWLISFFILIAAHSEVYYKTKYVIR